MARLRLYGEGSQRLLFCGKSWCRSRGVNGRTLFLPSFGPHQERGREILLYANLYGSMVCVVKVGRKT